MESDTGQQEGQEESEEERYAREDDEDKRIYIPFVERLLTNQMCESNRHTVNRAYDYLTSATFRSDRLRLRVVRDTVKEWFKRIKNIEISDHEGTLGKQTEDTADHNHKGSTVSPSDNRSPAPDDESDVVTSSTSSVNVTHSGHRTVEEADVTITDAQLINAAEPDQNAAGALPGNSEMSPSPSPLKCRAEKASADSSGTLTQCLKSFLPPDNSRPPRRDSGTSTTLSLSDDDECMVIAEFKPSKQPIVESVSIEPTPLMAMIPLDRKRNHVASEASSSNSSAAKSSRGDASRSESRKDSVGETSNSHPEAISRRRTSNPHARRTSCGEHSNSKPPTASGREMSNQNPPGTTGDEASVSDSKASDQPRMQRANINQNITHPLMTWVLYPIEIPKKPHCTSLHKSTPGDPRFGGGEPVVPNILDLPLQGFDDLNRWVLDNPSLISGLVVGDTPAADGGIAQWGQNGVISSSGAAGSGHIMAVEDAHSSTAAPCTVASPTNPRGRVEVASLVELPSNTPCERGHAPPPSLASFSQPSPSFQQPKPLAASSRHQTASSYQQLLPSSSHQLPPPAPPQQFPLSIPPLQLLPPAPPQQSLPPAPPQQSLPPVLPQQSLPPALSQQSLPPAPPQQSLPPAPPQQSLLPAPPQQSLPPAPPQQSLPPAPPQQSLPPAPPQQSLPPAPPQQSLPPAPPQQSPTSATSQQSLPPTPSHQSVQALPIAVPALSLPPVASQPSLCGLGTGQHFQFQAFLQNGQSEGQPTQFTNCMYCHYACTVANLIDHFVNSHSDVDPPSYLDWKKVQDEVIDNMPEQGKIRTGIAYLDDLSWITQGGVFSEPLKCKLCPYTEKVRSKMLEHVHDHRREKLEETPSLAPRADGSYRCRFCSFKCSNGDIFRSHCTSHTGEYTYTCGHCSFRGQQKEHVIEHLKFEHPRSVLLINQNQLPKVGQGSVYGYVCKPCGFVQLQKLRVTTHMLRDHPNNLGKVCVINMSWRKRHSEEEQRPRELETNIHGGRQPKLKIQSKQYDVRGEAAKLGSASGLLASSVSKPSRAEVWQRSREKVAKIKAARSVAGGKEGQSTVTVDTDSSSKLRKKECQSAETSAAIALLQADLLLSDSSESDDCTIPSASDKKHQSRRFKSRKSHDAPVVGHPTSSRTPDKPPVLQSKDVQQRSPVVSKRGTPDLVLPEPPAKKILLSEEVYLLRTPPSIADTISKLQAKLSPADISFPSGVAAGSGGSSPKPARVPQSSLDLDKMSAIKERQGDWHKRKKALVCSCLHVSQTPESFKLHRNSSIHRSEKRIQCFECGNKFDAAADYADHFWMTCAGVGSRVFACALTPSCLFITSRSIKFTDHIRDNHDGHKWIPCYWCGHRYITGESLVTHIQKQCSQKHLLKRGLEHDSLKFEDLEDEVVEVPEVVVPSPPTSSPAAAMVSEPAPCVPKSQLQIPEPASRLSVVYRCSDCPHESLERGVFIDHIKMEHPSRQKYSCRYCFKIYNLLMLALHIEKEHSDDLTVDNNKPLPPAIGAPGEERDAPWTTQEEYITDEGSMLQISGIVSLPSDQNWDDLPTADDGDDVLPAPPSPEHETPQADPSPTPTPAEAERHNAALGSDHAETVTASPDDVPAASSEALQVAAPLNETPLVPPVASAAAAAVVSGSPGDCGPQAFGIKITALDDMCRMAALTCRVLSTPSMGDELLEPILRKWWVDNESLRGKRPTVAQTCRSPLNIVSQLKTEEALQAMMPRHKLAHLYKCGGRTCSYSCDSEEEFQRHLSTQLCFVGNCTYCIYCCEPYKKVDGLASHITQQHGEAIFQCLGCLYRTKTKSNVALHSGICHANEPLARFITCTAASNATPEPDDDADMLALILPLVCTNEACQFLTMDIGMFKRHLLDCPVTPVLGTHTCFHCNAVMKIGSVEDHMRSHRIFNFQCRHCGHGTTTGNDIVIHLCEMHSTHIGRVFIRTTSSAAAAAASKINSTPAAVTSPNTNLQANSASSPRQSSSESSRPAVASAVSAAPVRIKVEAPDEPEPAIVKPTEPTASPPEVTQQPATPVRPPDPTGTTEAPGPVQSSTFSCGYQLCRFSSVDVQLLEAHLEECPFGTVGRLFCKQCFVGFRSGPAAFIEHLRTHQAKRFLCGLCPYEAQLPHYIKQHMRTAHGLELNQTKCVPRCSTTANDDTGEFVYEPMMPPLRIRISEAGAAVVPASPQAETTAAAARRRSADVPVDLSVENMDELPMQSIFPTEVRCGLCVSYATKVRQNMIRHLEQHRRDCSTSTSSASEATSATHDKVDSSNSTESSTCARGMSMPTLVAALPPPVTLSTPIKSPQAPIGQKTAIAMVVPPLAPVVPAISQPPILEPSHPVAASWELETSKPLPPYRCQICQTYRSHSRKIMSQHLLRELKLLRFSCTLCNFGPDDEAKVRSHFTSEHPHSAMSISPSVDEAGELEVHRLLLAQEAENGITPSARLLTEPGFTDSLPHISVAKSASAKSLQCPNVEKLAVDKSVQLLSASKPSVAKPPLRPSAPRPVTTEPPTAIAPMATATCDESETDESPTQLKMVTSRLSSDKGLLSLPVTIRSALMEPASSSSFVKPIIVESQLQRESATRICPSSSKESEAALLPCPACPFGNRPRLAWQQHVRNNHLLHLGFMCRLCERTFADGGQLSLHHQLMHFGQPYEGRRDNGETLDAFVDFLAQRVPDGKGGNLQERPIKLTCLRNGCPAFFTNLKKFYHHFADGECRSSATHESQPFHWPDRSNSPPSPPALPASAVAGSEVSSCLCPFCGFRAKGTDKVLTKRHILQHYGQRFASCFYCSEEFLVMSEVERHCFERHPNLPVRAKPIPIVHPVQILPVGTWELMILSVGDKVAHNPKVHCGGLYDLYSCHVCSFTTDSSSAARHHGQHAHQYAALIQLHTAALPLGTAEELIPRVLCPFCAFQASDEAVVRKHLARHIGPYQKCCGHCSKSFIKLMELRLHCIQQHPRLKYKCRRNEPVILPVENWTLVLVDKNEHPQHKPGGAYGCDMCEFTTDEIGEARYHGQHGHDKAAFFYSPGLRQRSTKQQVVSKSAPPVALTTAAAAAAVASIKSVEAPIPQAECTLCHEKLSGTMAWRDHALTRHPELNHRMRAGKDDVETTYQCIRCRYVGHTMVALLRHLNTFHFNRPLAYTEIRSKVMYQCRNCTFSTSILRVARAHVSQHVFAYQCRYCSKKAHSESSIFEHCRSKHPDKTPSSTANFRMGAERTSLLRQITAGVRTPCGQRTLHCLGPSEIPREMPHKRSPTHLLPSSPLSISLSSPSHSQSHSSSSFKSTENSSPLSASTSLPATSTPSTSTSATSGANRSKLRKIGGNSSSRLLKKRKRAQDPKARGFAALIAARKKRRISSVDSDGVPVEDCGFSFYGCKPDPVDWNRLRVRTHFRRIKNATMTGQHCRDVFNLFPVVLVKDFIKKLKPAVSLPES